MDPQDLVSLFKNKVIIILLISGKPYGILIYSLRLGCDMSCDLISVCEDITDGVVMNQSLI